MKDLKKDQNMDYFQILMILTRNNTNPIPTIQKITISSMMDNIQPNTGIDQLTTTIIWVTSNKLKLDKRYSNRYKISVKKSNKLYSL